MNIMPMFNTVRALKVALMPTAALAAMLLASTTVQAQVTQITSSQLIAPSTANFTGPVGLVSDPYVVTSSGSTVSLTFTNNRTLANNNNFNRINQQGGVDPNANFAGDFTPDTPLLRNTVTGSGLANAMTVTFSNGVSAFGFNFEPTGYLSANAATFTFNVFQGVGPLSTFTSSSVTTRDQEDGSAPFFGVRTTNSANSITSIQIFASSSTGNTSVSADDFVVSPVKFVVSSIPTTPEPGAVALLTGALLPMGLFAARRRR